MIDYHVKELIKRDRRICQERIRGITADNNFEVVNPNYLTPETGGELKAMAVTEGLLCYYTRIDNALERILRLDSFTKKDHRRMRSEVPAYLLGLIHLQKQRLA